MATKQAATPDSYNIAEMAAEELAHDRGADSRQRLRTLYLSRIAGRTGHRLRTLMGRQTRRS